MYRAAGDPIEQIQQTEIGVALRDMSHLRAFAETYLNYVAGSN